MKVKIGGYSNRLICNIHTRHMNKKYGLLWGDNKDYDDHLQEAIEDTIQSVYDVFNWIWFDRLTRKVDVRIDKSDTWSMDNTLAHIIVPMLKQLQETKHGSPLVADVDVPKDLRSTNADVTNDTDSNHHLRWDWVLDEMIWAFEQKSRDDWESDYYEYREVGPEESKDPNRLFGLALVWEDKKGRADHQKRMTKGFKLFGKYYENLWDQ